MKKILLSAFFLGSFSLGAKAQSHIQEHINDSIIGSLVEKYEFKYAQDSGTTSDEIGIEDYGFYNKSIYLCRFAGWAQNGRWHYLILTNNKAITSKTFDGKDLKTDLLELFKYLKETGEQISSAEKNRLIMDFVKNW